MLSLYDGNGMLGLDLGSMARRRRFSSTVRGIIRWRHAGDLNERVWREELQPLWDQYNRRAGLDEMCNGHPAGADADRPGVGRHRHRQFGDEAQEQAFREITSQLRCPKCQNNGIADSNAMIAADSAAKVYELMQRGKRKGRSLTIWWPATVILSATSRP